MSKPERTLSFVLPEVGCEFVEDFRQMGEFLSGQRDSLQGLASRNVEPVAMVVIKIVIIVIAKDGMLSGEESIIPVGIRSDSRAAALSDVDLEILLDLQHHATAAEDPALHQHEGHASKFAFQEFQSMWPLVVDELVAR